jgi:hypothetical protein
MLLGEVFLDFRSEAAATYGVIHSLNLALASSLHSYVRIISCLLDIEEDESCLAGGERYFITTCGLFVTNQWRLG